MGITVLPNYGEEAGKALSELGKGLGQIINPYAEFQKALTRRAAEDPEIIQRLADQEAISPGSITTGRMSKLLPRHILEAAINTPQSYESRYRSGMSAALAAMSPDVRQRFLASRAVGTTPEGLVTEPYKAGAAQQFIESPAGEAAKGEVGAKVATGETPAALVRNKIDLDMYSHGLEFFKDLQSTPEGQKYAQLLGGYGAFPSLMQDSHFRQMMDYHWQVFNARDQDRRNNAWDRMTEADAIRWADMTRLPGATAQDWKEFLFNPAVRDRVNKLATTGGQAGNDKDRLYLQMRDSFLSTDPKARAMSTALWSSTINKIEGEITGTPTKAAAPENTRGFKLLELNKAINAGLPPDAPRIQAIWGPAPEGKEESPLAKMQRAAHVGPGKHKLRYIIQSGDNKGQEVPPDGLRQLMGPQAGGAPTAPATPASAAAGRGAPPDSLFQRLYQAVGGDERQLLDTLKTMGYYNEPK